MVVTKDQSLLCPPDTFQVILQHAIKDRLKEKRTFPQENQVLETLDFCGNVLILC